MASSKASKKRTKAVAPKKATAKDVRKKSPKVKEVNAATKAKWANIIHVYRMSGGNGCKAYQSVNPNAKDTTARSAFWKLLQNITFQKMLEEYDKRNEEELSISFNDQVRKLNHLYQLAYSRGELWRCESILDKLNKMFGYYEADNNQHGDKYQTVIINNHIPENLPPALTSEAAVEAYFKRLPIQTNSGNKKGK